MSEMVKKTQLVGILNCTPDSYFDGGLYFKHDQAIEQGLRLFDEGADMVDIGGESTRPLNSLPVSTEEEIARVLPVIEGIRKHTNLPLSIDTFKPTVAQAALDAGANLVNDITGGVHPLMRQLIAKRRVPIIIMHMKGAPHTLPNSVYPQGLLSEISSFFKKRIKILLQDGVQKEQIILDPGIGGGSFGKTPQQNMEILKNLKTFQAFGYPVFIGLSRKSFLQKILKKEASELLSTTLALNTMSALEGVDYIRVHDVSQHREMLTLLQYMETI